MSLAKMKILGACGAGLLATGCTGLTGSKQMTSTDKVVIGPAPTETAAGGKPHRPVELSSEKAAELSLTMAESLDKGGKDIEAVAYYELARQQNPELAERTARRLGVLYDRIDDPTKSMAEFAAAVKKNPKDAGLLSDVGYSYYNRGKWVEAEEHLRRAVAIDKSLKRAWTNLGLALAQQNKTIEALDAFEKAVTPAEAQANLAFVLTTQGRKDEARVAYERALQIEPTLKLARDGLAQLDAPAKAPTGVVPAAAAAVAKPVTQ